LKRIATLFLVTLAFGIFVPIFSAGFAHAESNNPVLLADHQLGHEPTEQPNPPPVDPNEPAPANDPDQPADPDQETPDLNDYGDTCINTVGLLSWILCPVIELADRVSRIIGNWLVGLLEFNPIITDIGGQDPTSSGLYNAWGVFRDIANVLLVVAFLLIIYLVTTGNQAYVVQRMLPRLVIATIGIQFSFVLSALMVDIGNVLGAGIAELFNSINQEVISGIDDGTLKDSLVPDGTLGQGVGAGIGYVLSLLGIYLFVTTTAFTAFPIIIVSGLIGLFVALLILSLRQMAIVALIVTSPLSFLLAIFPGTQGIFKEWSDNLIKLILVYPLVVLLFSVSGLLSSLALLGSTTETFNQFLASLLPVATLFMVPYLFRFAGRIFRGAGGLIQGGGKSLSQGLMGDYNDPNSWKSQKRGNAWSSRLNRRGGQKSISRLTGKASRFIPGIDPDALGHQVSQMRAGRWEGALDIERDKEAGLLFLNGSKPFLSMDRTEDHTQENIDKGRHAAGKVWAMNSSHDGIIQGAINTGSWIGGSHDRALNAMYAIGEQVRGGELSEKQGELKFETLKQVTKGQNRFLGHTNYNDIIDEGIQSGDARHLYNHLYNNDSQDSFEHKKKVTGIFSETFSERNGQGDARAMADIISDPRMRQYAASGVDPDYSQRFRELTGKAARQGMSGGSVREDGDGKPEFVGSSGRGFSMYGATPSTEEAFGYLHQTAAETARTMNMDVNEFKDSPNVTRGTKHQDQRPDPGA